MLFALFFGVAINLSGEAGRPVALFFVSLNQVIFKLVETVLLFAPVSVFALMAWVTASSGFAMLSHLAALVGTLYLSCLLVLTLVYGLILCLARTLSAAVHGKNDSGAVVCLFHLQL